MTAELDAALNALNELLGKKPEVQPPQKKPRRQPKGDADPKRNMDRAFATSHTAKELVGPTGDMTEEGPMMDAPTVIRGVSITWLASIMGMSTQTIAQRLSGCEPIRVTGRGGYYMLRQALPYLMEPKVDVAAIIAKMRPQDLPPFVMKDFWAGMKARQAFLRESGELWRTSDVQTVFAEVFKRMRSVLQLVPEQLERTVGLTNEQRKQIIGLTDNLQQLLYDALVKMMEEKRTPSDREKLLSELGVEDLEVEA